MMRILAITGFLIVVASSGVRADFVNGNTLYGWCQQNRALAGAYILGVADAAVNENTADAIRAIGGGPLLCIPPQVSGEQLVDIVCRDLANQASVRHMPAQALASVSLILVWPCSKK